MKSIIFSITLILACFFENQSFGMNQTSGLMTKKPKNKQVCTSTETYQCNDCEVFLTRKYNYRTHMMRLHAFCTWCKSYPIGKQEPKWYISVSEQERKNVYNHLIECAREFNGVLYGCSMCFGVNCTMHSIHFVKECSGKIEKLLSNKNQLTYQNCYGVLKKNSSEFQSDHKSSHDTSRNIDSSNLIMTSQDQILLKDFFEIIHDDNVGQELYDLVNTDFTSNSILNTHYKINSIRDNELNRVEVTLKNICYQCPEPKKLARSEYYKNHMIRQHGICPWCCVQFPNDGKRLKKLSLRDPKKAAAHLIVCAEKNNTSLFVCNICFGTRVNKNSVHIKKSCKGVVSKQSKKIDTAQETELLELSEELVLLSKSVDQQDQSTLIRLQDEHDSSQQREIYLPDDFFTETNLSTPNNSTDLAIVHEDQIIPNHRSHELWCKKCNMEFTAAENRIKHILSIHYACPWCNDLEYLKKDAFRSISLEDKEIRVDHIKKCAQQQKRSSLWKCQNCSALFNYANNDHSCGRDCQLNLMINKIQNTELGLKISEKTICYKCPEPKKFARTRSCINHIIRKHASCPECSISFANKAKPFKDLILHEQKLAIDHLIQCTQRKNIFSCNTCFGVKVGDRAVHIKKSCTGSVCKKTYTA